jgi:AraC family transcriptional regulator
MNDPHVRLYEGRWFHVERYRCLGGRRDRGLFEAAEGPEVVFPLRGLFVREVRGRRHVADANQVLFFARGEPYRVHHPLGCGDESLVLGLPPQALDEEQGMRWPDADETHRLAPVASRLAVARLLAAVGAGDALGIEDAGGDILGAVLAPGGAAADVPPRRHEEIVAATQVALAREPRATLEALASRAGISPFHLSRLFRRLTGASLRAYRNRMRVQEAAVRLAAGERDLTGLALDLGFAHHSHFTNTFRRVCGLSPSEFRRRSRTRSG